MSVQTSLDYLRHTPGDIALALIQYRDAVNAAAARAGDSRYNSEITRQTFEDAVAAARQTALDDLAALERHAVADKRAIETATLPVAPSEPLQAILAELREQRAWTRAERMLNSGNSIQQIAETAAASGDTAIFAALRTELPTLYPGDELDGVLAEVENAEEPLLTDAQRTAREAREEVRNGWPAITLALGHCRAEIDGGFTVMELPTWDRTGLLEMNPKLENAGQLRSVTSRSSGRLTQSGA